MIKIAVILLTLLLSKGVIADIYKYTDNDGHVYYTDEPRNSLYKLIIKSKAVSYSPKNNIIKAQNFTGTNKKRFTDLIEQTAYRHQVDAKLLHAVIQTESAYNSSAQSPKGAVGLMQLMPETARRFGVIDRNNPDQNVDGGARYLKHLITLFNPNLDLAVAAYNAGENAVIRHKNSIPPYPETQNYVKQVLALYHR
ncbi:lytic transglycosylase domain-containing protein [Methylobacter psychrophilus]|uniref:lytic transglycosylase domain-containing protein n=1 Tax=Methylobacter psychrophilus TaxID=96941 RepID=UPI0021D4F436|nr:lytic transglycosylase domain-containing protein [Methylobacter psychrophilus]